MFSLIPVLWTLIDFCFSPSFDLTVLTDFLCFVSCAIVSSQRSLYRAIFQVYFYWRRQLSFFSNVFIAMFQRDRSDFQVWSVHYTRVPTVRACRVPELPLEQLQSFTVEFYWVLLGFTGFYWILLGFTGFYWVLPGFTSFQWTWNEDVVNLCRKRRRTKRNRWTDGNWIQYNPGSTELYRVSSRSRVLQNPIASYGEIRRRRRKIEKKRAQEKETKKRNRMRRGARRKEGGRRDGWGRW